MFHRNKILTFKNSIILANKMKDEGVIILFKPTSVSKSERPFQQLKWNLISSSLSLSFLHSHFHHVFQPQRHLIQKNRIFYSSWLMTWVKTGSVAMEPMISRPQTLILSQRGEWNFTMHTRWVHARPREQTYWPGSIHSVQVG